MGKVKSLKSYEKKLREMVTERLGGVFDDFLELPVHTAAQCLQMLDRVQEELMSSGLTSIEFGSSGQQRTVSNPLLVTYKDLQRTMVQHYETLGINYRATPSKITEKTSKGGNVDADPLGQVYQHAIETLNGVSRE